MRSEEYYLLGCNILTLSSVPRTAKQIAIKKWAASKADHVYSFIFVKNIDMNILRIYQVSGLAYSHLEKKRRGYVYVHVCGRVRVFFFT